MICRSFGWCFLQALLLWTVVCCVSSRNVSPLPTHLSGVRIERLQPARVTQFVRTTITATLNSSLCVNAGEDTISNAQLILPKAGSDGRDLAFRSGASVQNSCRNLQFRLLLGREARAGRYQAYVLLPELHRILQPPIQLEIEALPILSMQSRFISVRADQTAFSVGVQLDRPAGDKGVTVRLQLLGSGAARIWDNTLTWSKGSSGLQSFWVSLQYVPSSGRFTMQLAQPQGAVSDPAAASTVVAVQSPVIGFTTNLGYYRGLNNSTPLLHLTVSGTSSFSSQFNYTTYLLPGSRPSIPCHPLASACSSADIQAVSSVTVSGTRWLQPGQQQVEPIKLPLDWYRLSTGAELRVGLKIVGQQNARVALQQGEAAAIIFGTPPGHCPPGATLLSDTNSSKDSAGPAYTNVAALQELAFTLSTTRAAANSSSSSSRQRTASGNSVTAVQAADSSNTSTVLDLDPPFSPMVNRYVGLLPPKPRGSGSLLLASNRWGDAVVVDATACLGLNSARYQVQWSKSRQMWRQQFSLARQRTPCWLRVHVFTHTAALSAASAPAQVGGSAGSDGSSRMSSRTWDLPQDFVLYRTYTIRLIPLKSPEQMSLRSITFRNNATTVIACGVPRGLSHLFQTTPPPVLSSVMGLDTNESRAASSNASASSLSMDLLVGRHYEDQARNAGSSSSDSSSSSDAATVSRPIAAAGAAVVAAASVARLSGAPPRPLVPAPGQVVQVAYLVMKKPPGLLDLGSGSMNEQQNAAGGTEENAGARSQLRQEQYSLFDAVSNRTVIWNKFSSFDCAQDRYIPVPLAQMKPDMKMIPELLDVDAEGVNVTMTQAALASFSSKGSSSRAAASDSSTGSSNGSMRPAADSKVDYGGRSSLLGGAEAFSGQTLCAITRGAGKAAASSALLSSKAASNSSMNSSIDPCGLRLPGVTAEVPIILTADEGRSSKTYTLFIYSNESAADAVRNMVLPQEAAAAESAATSAAVGVDDGSDAAADAVRLSAAYFADRPVDWPKSPAQSDKCAVCPNGTYSTRVDSYDCKVCPPGKYAASPFSTSCLFCPPGTFSYYWGAPACRTCLPGTFAAQAGSLYCDICREGTTTTSEGSTSCDITVTSDGSELDSLNGAVDYEYALLLSFGVVLDGALLEAVSRSTTGINGSSEGIVAVLVKSDTATALNVSLGSVQVLGVQQLDSRQLLVNVSATVPVAGEVQEQKDGATADAQDLAADELIQRLIDDPNTFLRTTQTLGAEGVSVQDLITLKTRKQRMLNSTRLHAILWPSLFGSLVIVGLLVYLWLRWRRRRQLQRLTQQWAGGLEFAAAAAASSIVGFLGRIQGGTIFAASGGGAVGVPAVGSPSMGAIPRAGYSTSNNCGRGSIALRRNWQRYWSSDMRVVVNSSGASGLDSPGSSSGTCAGGANCSGQVSSGSSDGSIGRSSSASTGSCSPSSTHSGSGCSDGISVTLDVGDIRSSGAGGGDFCYNEESFQARLRAKQLGAAGAALPRHW